MSNQMPPSPDVAPDVADEKKLLLSFELAPSWTRASPDAHHERFRREDRWDAVSDTRTSTRDPDRDYSRPPRREDRAPRRDGRPPRRDERAERGAGGNAPRRPSPADASGMTARGGNSPRRDGPPRDAVEPLPLEIRLLPEQKALGVMIRRIQTSHRAYPLRDMARLFLDNPTSCLVRIESRKDPTLPLYQCKVCGLPALSEDEIGRHVLGAHMESFFEIAEVEGDAPSGSFICVARCGLTGELLGPPNHHSYGARMQEMLRTRCAHVSPEEYRGRIEIVREPEAIEQWREQARKRRLFRVKAAVKQTAEQKATSESAVETQATEQETGAVNEPAVPLMERQAAELHFMREILPRQIGMAWNLLATVEVAIQSPSPRLNAAVRDLLNREDRFPASLFFALRGAFRHRQFHIFKTQSARGPEFVMASPLVALDTSHAVADLRAIMAFVAEHPACTRQELLAAVTGDDKTRVTHFSTQINWLVEKAHLLEYYNGVLCAPMDFPHFRYLPSERPGE